MSKAKPDATYEDNPLDIRDFLDHGKQFNLAQAINELHAEIRRLEQRVATLERNDRHKGKR